MLRIYVTLDPSLDKNQAANKLAEFTGAALAADAISISKKNYTLTVTVMDATPKSATLLSQLYHDPATERISTEVI